MRRNPGRVISLYDVSELMCEAFVKAASVSVAISGFRKTGIWPYNREIFSDVDFAPSEVTDQPETVTVTLITLTTPMVMNDSTVQQVTLPITPTENQQCMEELPITVSAGQDYPVPEPVSDTSPNSSFNVAPADILPLPKMSVRRATKRKCKSEKAVEITTEDYRQDLATAEATKTIKAIKKDRKPPKKRVKNQRLQEINEDTLCELCGECFSSTTDGSGWKKCPVCLKWFHAGCSDGVCSICV